MLDFIFHAGVHNEKISEGILSISFLGKIFVDYLQNILWARLWFNYSITWSWNMCSIISQINNLKVSIPIFIWAFRTIMNQFKILEKNIYKNFLHLESSM